MCARTLIRDQRRFSVTLLEIVGTDTDNKRAIRRLIALMVTVNYLVNPTAD